MAETTSGSSFEPNNPKKETGVHLRALESENDLEKKTRTLKGLSETEGMARFCTTAGQ